MAWEKGNSGFDKVAGSSVMGLVTKGLNYVLGHMSHEFKDAVRLENKVIGMDAAAIQADELKQAEDLRKKNVAAKGFRDTATEGLKVRTEGGSPHFVYNQEADVRAAPTVKNLNTTKFNTVKF